MKLYSLITICITLGLFYGLAVFEQNKKANEEKLESNLQELVKYHRYSNCTRNFTANPSSFDMTVTGKEHRYLNTGITFLGDDIHDLANRDDLNSFIAASEK